MNPDPDFSAAHLELDTDAADGLVSAGLLFAIGRGNDFRANAIESTVGHLVGADVAGIYFSAQHLVERHAQVVVYA